MIQVLGINEKFPHFYVIQNLEESTFVLISILFYSVEALGERTTRLHTAIQFLEESKKCSTKKNHGQTMYLLGMIF